MKCSNCGNPGLSDRHSFCFECGAKIIPGVKANHNKTSEETTANAKQERTDSADGVETGAESNVSGDDSSQRAENQMKRKPLHGDQIDESLVKDAKRITSENTQSGARHTATVEDSAGNVQPTPPADQHRSAARTADINSARQEHDGSTVCPGSGSSGTQDAMDEIMDAKQPEEALKSLALTSPKAADTPEGNLSTEGEAERTEEKFNQGSSVHDQGFQLSKVLPNNTPQDNQGKFEKTKKNLNKDDGEGSLVSVTSVTLGRVENTGDNVSSKEEPSGSPESMKHSSAVQKLATETPTKNGDSGISRKQSSFTGEERNEEKPDLKTNETAVVKQKEGPSGHGAGEGKNNERKDGEGKAEKHNRGWSMKEGVFYKKDRGDQNHQDKPKQKQDKKKKFKDPLTSTISDSVAEVERDQHSNVPGRVNILDVFEKDRGERMTVVFHAVLAPHFKFNQKDGDRVFVRFGGPAFKDFNVNILEMKPVRNLQDDYILLEGNLRAPVKLLRNKRPYKYIVLKVKKPEPYLWERLFRRGPFTNRCFKVPRDYCASRGIWHQYDAAIFPEPTIAESVRNYFPLIKAMDPVHSRVLATQAMLPQWEGFCTESQEGSEMTAWEAVTAVLNVEQCMCKSESMELFDNHSLQSDVPQEYNFGKVLFQYIKPRISKNAELEVIGRRQKSSLEKQTLRLASSIAITFLCVRFQIYPDGNGLRDLLQGLSLHFNSNAKTCLEFENLALHFPEDSWIQMGEAIQRLCNYAAKDMYDHHEWLLAVPLMHFLLGQSAPFHAVLVMEKPRDGKWWGAQGMQTKAVRHRALSGTNSPVLMLKQIAPSFELDPLFRRTFLLALPVKEYSKVTGSPAIRPLDVFTTLAKVLPEKSYWSIDEWMAVCTSIRNQTPKIVSMLSQEVLSDLGVKDEALHTAEATLRVLIAIINNKRLELLEVILECIKVLSILLPFLQNCNDNIGERENTKDLSEPRKIFKDLTDILTKSLKNYLSSKMPCYIFKSVDEELRIWTSLLSLGWPCEQYAENWSEKLLHEFRLRLEQRDAEDLVELLSKVDMSKYHGNVAECITAVTFSKVEEILVLRKEDEKLFENMSRNGMKCPQAAKFGELLTMMLMKCWPVVPAGSELSTLDVLKHVLSWKLWPGYFEFFGKRSQNRAILSDDGQEKLLMATTVLEAIGLELKRGFVKVCFLQLLRDKSDHFLKLHELVSEKDKGLKEILQKRCHELVAFEEERERIVAFIKSCSMLKRVNLDSLRDKSEEDVYGTAIKDLAQETNSGPVVKFFGLSSSMKMMIQRHYDVKNSQFFQKFWKEAGEKALKSLAEQDPPVTHLTVESVHRLVWNSAYESMASLRDRFMNGQITLKETDKYFKAFQDRYNDLSTELERMLEVEIIGNVKKCLKKRIKQLEQYHKLHRYIDAARIILEFRDFFGLTGDFQVVEDMKNQTSEEFKKKALSSVNEKFLRAGQALSNLSERKIGCLDAVVRCKRLIDWLRKTIPGGAQELKVLVDLAIISAGETDMETDRITCLHTSCLGFAPLIFDLKEEFGFDELMEKCEPVWSAAESDPNLPRKLIDTNRHLEWLKGVKESHGSVAMTSLMQAEAINARGIYRVGHLKDELPPGDEKRGRMNLDSVIHLTLPPKDGDTEVEEKAYSLNELKDLQSKLMLIAGKAAQGKAEEVERFVETLQGSLRLATVYIDLCETGEVSHLEWRETFCCKAALVSGDSVISILRAKSEGMEECLRQWREEIHSKRLQYRQLNHYTTQQLLLLREQLANLRLSGLGGVEKLPLALYNLLESVLSGVDPAALSNSLKASGVLGDDPGHDILRSYESISMLGPSQGYNHGSPSTRNIPEPNGQSIGKNAAPSISDQYQSLVDKVEDIGCYSTSAEEIVIAAMVACGDVSGEDLLVWCFKHKEDDVRVGELYSQALSIPKYAVLLGEKTGDPMEQENEEPVEGTLEETMSETHQDVEETGIMETDAIIDQTCSGKYLSLDELGCILTHLASLGPNKSPRRFPRYLKRGRPNLVLVPKDDILPTVLALYIQDGNQSLPSPEEVLICTDETSAEEIELLWRRALGDRERRLFCLVNADLVDYSVSQQAADRLNLLMQETGTKNEGCGLVVICSSENEDRAHIVAALDQYRVASAPHCPATSEIQDYLKRQFQKSFCSQQGHFYGKKLPWTPASAVDKEKVTVRFVVSDRSGCGKSLVVRRLSQQLESFLNNDIVSRQLKLLGTDEPLCVTVPIHGKTVNQSAVVEALNPRALLPDVPLSRIFHLDISPSVSNGLDSFLFNLLILGTLTDTRGQVWRKRPCDLYVVEITDIHPLNVPRSTGARGLPASASSGDTGPTRHSKLRQSQSVAFFQYFPTIKCSTPEKTLEVMRHQPIQGTQGLHPLFDDGEFRTANIQRAFQYLKLFEAGQSLDNFNFVLGQILGDHSECLEMLIRHCGMHDPSWAELRHFVNFLNSQLRACEESHFCDMALVGDTLEGFRTFVVGFMILMSRDFATPSIDETNVMYTGSGEDDEENEIEQYQLRRRWETSSHPYIFFNQDRITMTFLGFHIDQNGNLIDPERRCIIQERLMTRHLRTGLHVQRVDFDTNYESWSKGDRIEKLCSVMGVEWPYDPDNTYELTTDNMKKILAIHMRFRCGIPVVIMGETGCGKTRLIRYMCGLQSGPGGPRNMLLMKVHGGTTYEDIEKKVSQAENMADLNQKFNIDTVLFFDEANTTEALGMIKEVMVDRRINGRPVGCGLPRLQFIAACNPYRRHTEEMINKLESAGLGYHVKAEETDDRLGCIPLRHLVYRVHALSASMRPLVWDFGQLKPEIETMYTRQIVARYVLQEKKIPGNQYMVNAITTVLAASQQYMREQTDECSFVSLRDVERAMTVMVWFYEHLNVLTPLMDQKPNDSEDEESEWEDTDGEEEEEDQIHLERDEEITPVTRALVLSLGVCYHARLQNRDNYRRKVAPMFRNPLCLPGGHRSVLDEVSRCQRAVLNKLELGPNIARNTALSENVFMMVVCIELRIPLFVVGKPGSSKSLAKTVVADNMQGDAARSDLFKAFKQVHMASYQCSPLSTPDGIVATFRQCSKLQEGKNLDKFVSVVVLDEVGLAEDSPLMPLKSLHPLLEDGVTTDDVIDADERPSRVAFIGLSNWALDPAKMNRGIMLSRTVPDTKELVESAMGICSTDATVQSLVAPLINALAKGYHDLYLEQRRLERLKDSKKDEFFGLRDFYSLIKMVYSIARERNEEPHWSDLEHAIRRNFGGLDEIDPLRFFKKHFPTESQARERQGEDFSSICLIKASLERRNSEGESRYLLVLTENYAALRIIQQQLLKEEDDAVVIFGSSFPKDQEYTQICRNINRIKVCMETGRTVILLNLESLYESLYDALNQYYVYFGGQKYVDLGLGSHRVKCRVSDEFRLIVIAEKDVVYSKFPIPLINRLEKHFLVTSTSLSHAQMIVKKRLADWAKHFAESSAPRHLRNSQFRRFTVGDAFVGFHDDTPSSVVLQVCSEMENEPTQMTDDSEDVWEEQVFNRCKDLLLQCATPDSVARLPSTSLAPSASALWDMYFKTQQHSSLAAYLGRLLRGENAENATVQSQGGFLVQVTTHSRLLSSNDMKEVSTATKLSPLNQCLVSLQQFHTELQFSNRVKEFFVGLGGREGLLVVQCDLGDQNTNLVACARHLLIEQRNLFIEERKEIFEKQERTSDSVREYIAPIHIVVVVQLPRIAGGCSEFVGFQGGRWISTHIDELRPPAGHIPPIEFLVDRSVSELFNVVAPLAEEEEPMDLDDQESVPYEERPIIEETPVQDRIDVVSVLRGCVQAAAGRIDDVPGMERRSTRRIELLLSLLPESSSDLSDFPFAIVLIKRIEQLLRERDERAGPKASDWLRSEALSGTGVQESGTFRKALWQRVYSVVIPIISEVIAYVDRDGNLSLANNEQTWTSRFWLAMLQSSSVAVMHYDGFLNPDQNVIRERVLMTTSGYSRHCFQCQFPFSWLIKEKTDSMWRDASNISVQSNENQEVSLRRLMYNSDLGPLLEIIDAEGYGQASAERYLHDFVHMVYKPTADHEDQLVSQAILAAARELFIDSGGEESGKEFVLDIAIIHVVYAHIQERLNTFAQLVQAQPDIVAQLLDALPPNENEMVLDAVAVQMCISKLTPTEEELEDHQQRLLWCNRVLAIRAPMETMLHKAPKRVRVEEHTSCYGKKAMAVLRACRTNWQRVSAVRLFIEHVCPPGSIVHPADIKNVFMLWKAIGDDTDFSTPDTMRVIERFLVKCSESVSQRNNSYGTSSCPICLGILKDPVKLPCKHVCCLTCVSQWCSKEQSCPLCRHAIPADFRIQTTDSLKQAVEEHIDFRRRCNSFFMELVSLFCFGKSGHIIDPALFDMLMSYVVYARAKTKDFSPFPEHGVDATPVVRSFLLQQLLRSSDEEVANHLRRYLTEARELRPDFDHVLQVCLLFVQCKEDSLISTYSGASDLINVTVKVAQQMCSEATDVLTTNALHSAESVDVQKLEGVAKARYALTLAAGFMYKTTVDPDGRLNEPQLKNDLKKLFEDCRRMCLKTLSATPRMYLLKQLARRYGIDAITVVSERKELEWVLPAEAREKQAEDMVPDRFIVYGDTYRDMREAVAKSVLSNSTSEITAVREGTAVYPLIKNVLLLLAVYREATMCSAFAAQQRQLTLKAQQALSRFVQEDQQLSPKARTLAGQLLNNAQGAGFQRLRVVQGQSPMERTLAEIVIHATAVFSCAGQNTLLEPFCQLMEQPAAMNGMYFPTMPDDNLQEAMTGMQGQTGKWYTCPKGHPYFIGDCGGAVEVRVCPECKVNIGGINYQLQPGNVLTQGGDRTSKGHVLGHPQTRPLAAVPERTMSPVVLSIVRLLMHSSMIMGACTDPAAMSALIQPRIPPEAVVEFLWQHLSRDIDVLSRAIGRSPDDAALTIHRILAEITSSLAKQPPNVRVNLSGKTGRQEWEAAFSNAFITPVLKNLQDNVQKCLQLLVGDKRLGNDPLMRQLYEIDVPDEDLSKGISPTCPVLWRYRAQVTVEHLAHTFQEVVASNDPSKCRVLAKFLREEPKLRAVCYLPDIIRLQQLLMDRFHRRIDRTEAERFKLKDFTKQLPQATKREFNKLILSFKAAWNLVRSYLDQAGRLRIPSDYCDIRFDSNSPLAMLLPTTSGIGICSTSLVFYLCSLHNDFLHSYYNITGGVIKDAAHVSLVEATSSHLIGYDVDRDLMPLVLAQCNYSLEVGKGTVVEYNWAGLERQLIDRFIRGRPLIDYQDERFAFSKDTGIDTVFAILKMKIKQVPLSTAIRSNIIVEFRSNLSDICDSLTSLDIAIGFLSSAGGRPEMLISEYLHQILRMPNEAGLRSGKAQQYCCLKHIVSLWRLLTLERARILLKHRQDPFENLPVVFKQKMDNLQMFTFNRFWYETGSSRLDKDTFICDVLQLIVLNLKTEAAGTENMRISDYLLAKDLDPIPGLEDTAADVLLKHVVYAWQRVLELNEAFHETRASAIA